MYSFILHYYYTNLHVCRVAGSCDSATADGHLCASEFELALIIQLGVVACKFLPSFQSEYSRRIPAEVLFMRERKRERGIITKLLY
jgi:hypothetical protein